MTATFAQDGSVVFPETPSVLDWAQAAHRVACEVVKTPGDLRHGRTWRVGVDELPNEKDGSVNGVPFIGPWSDLILKDLQWHSAQLSVVYPGYPRQDPTDTDAAHRYRVRRDAAHVDGLLPEGALKRRFLKEPHAFILGVALNTATASPLVIWRGSHRVMGRAFSEIFQDVAPHSWCDVDVTDVYQAARRTVFETCTRVEVPILPGQAVLLHRHLLHGVAPWGDGDAPEEGRMIAYFRPLLRDVADWL